MNLFAAIHSGQSRVSRSIVAYPLLVLAMLAGTAVGAEQAPAIIPDTPAKLFPLESVRLLETGPFYPAVKANRDYILALDPDRLLAPFRREAGLPLKAQPYGNWESGGLDGHTAGHYLSALSNMIASGDDTAEGLLRKRLDAMIDELQVCQTAFGDGYVGGVPGSRQLWTAIAGGDIQAINRKWVPWYNLHKTFAGLRDAYLETGSTKARDVLVRLGDWCVNLTSHLSDEQMQKMLDQEHGGMNEVLADIYAITGDRKYLTTAERFNHHAILDPLIQHQDKLTGKHANTQIPKVIGLERIATLTGDKAADSGARFFWENVTQQRSVVFGGNSVSEHFNDPHDFRGLLLHQQGPETCNTYNMLRLTEELFSSAPNAAYADYYERALYNHILASINPTHPGYVYFTSIRPDHYRVYSVPDKGFWCCVGTGMENPGKYGQFIYARASDGIYVNLFIASELKDSSLGLSLRQDTAFPDEESSRLTVTLAQPQSFTLHLRQPGWVAPGSFTVKVNGDPVPVTTAPSSYVSVRREWRNGDKVEITMPMHTTVEALPDGSPWYAILHGPIVLAHPAGTWELTGLRADDSRMAHVATGPMVPLDQVPVLLTKAGTIPSKVVADRAAGPLNFRLVDVMEPSIPDGLTLIPFFRLHDSRYQMYWETTTREALAVRKEQLAATERARAAREAATLDWVAPGEQQPEVEHAYKGEDTESGIHNGRHWRHGRQFQYTFNARGEKAAVLSVTYSGDDSGRTFEIYANDTLIATQSLIAEKRGDFVEKSYAIPASVLASASDSRVTIKFVAKEQLAGGVFEIRLLRSAGAAPAKLEIDLSAPGKPISADLFGIFFEDLNYAADGGLYGELLQNRSFEYSPTEQSSWGPFSFWELVKTGDGDGKLGLGDARPVHVNNSHYLLLTVLAPGKGVGIGNKGFDRIPLEAGKSYEASFWAYQTYMGRMWSGTEAEQAKPMPVVVRLEAKNGEVLAEASLDVKGRAWQKHSVTLTPSRNEPEARFVLLAQAQGCLALDMVSLFPRDTFKGRANGLRRDLAQSIADLHPKFMRFPGGCLVHGPGIRHYYDWKKSVGPVEQRQAQRNSWGYHQTFGLGYFEFFQFCEDIGAKPLPVVTAGVCCQHAGDSPGRGQEGLPMAEMPAYIQDVLDLIEWANGPVDSKWGAVRAAAGHPAPFGLKYVGVGNEDAITPEFKERFRMVFEALQAKHPEIVVVGTAGPFPKGEDFDKGWAFARESRVPLVDEHYYVSPQWFWDNLTRYDNYDRKGPKVYVGEYAAHDTGKRNTLRSAIAEAAYLTSLERNGDIVSLASYAPMLSRRGHTQWTPDLIYFNAETVFPSLNYAVQQLFMLNQGNVMLPAKFEGNPAGSRMAVSAMRDNLSGDLIVKIVNGDEATHTLAVRLAGASKLPATAERCVFGGAPADTVNPDDAPPAIVPHTEKLPVSTDFNYEAPANSLTILRIRSL